jgi:hypothetical protein
MSVIDMEFPPESYDVFDSEQFETARARPSWRRGHGGDAPDETQRQMSRPLPHRSGRDRVGDAGQRHERLPITGFGQVQAHIPGVASRPQDQEEYDDYRLGGQLYRHPRQQHLGVYGGEGGPHASRGDQDCIQQHQGDGPEERVHLLCRGRRP